MKIDLDEKFEYRDDAEFRREFVTLVVLTLLSGCVVGAATVCFFVVNFCKPL